MSLMPKRALALLALLGGLLGCPKEPQKIEAPPMSKKPPDWKAGFKYKLHHDPETKTLTVDLQIAPGFHAYTIGETIGKPLALELDKDSKLSLDGDVKYPKGQPKELPLGRSVIVEGQAKIEAKLKPNPEAPEAPEAPEGSKLKGHLQYQVCTDEACDRPRRVPFELWP